MEQISKILPSLFSVPSSCREGGAGMSHCVSLLVWVLVLGPALFSLFFFFLGFCFVCCLLSCFSFVFCFVCLTRCLLFVCCLLVLLVS